MEMKNVQFITLHCSATRPSMQVGAKDIRAWHKAKLRPKTAGGKAKVVGHRDFPNVHKACPCFEAKAWAKDNGFG